MTMRALIGVGPGGEALILACAADEAHAGRPGVGAWQHDAALSSNHRTYLAAEGTPAWPARPAAWASNKMWTVRAPDGRLLAQGDGADEAACRAAADDVLLNCAGAGGVLARAFREADREATALGVAPASRVLSAKEVDALLAEPKLDAWEHEAAAVRSWRPEDLGLATPAEPGLYVWEGAVVYREPTLTIEGVDDAGPEWKGTVRPAHPGEAARFALGLPALSSDQRDDYRMAVRESVAELAKLRKGAGGRALDRRCRRARRQGSGEEGLIVGKLMYCAGWLDGAFFPKRQRADAPDEVGPFTALALMVLPEAEQIRRAIRVVELRDTLCAVDDMERHSFDGRLRMLRDAWKKVAALKAIMPLQDVEEAQKRAGIRSSSCLRPP